MKHVKIPPFHHARANRPDDVRPARRAKRLATVAAGAALTAVAAGITAGPAMAATGPLDPSGATTLSAAAMRSTHTTAAGATPSPGSPFALDSAMVAPIGGAPIAKQAPNGPLSHVARSSSAAHQPAQPVAGVGTAATAGQSSASKGANAASAAQPGTSSPAQPAAPAPAPAPAPKPYLIYDSVTPQAIPAGQKVATYATGGYAVPASVVAGRDVMWIDTQGTDPAAQALDVEPGDATPSVAASWAYQKLSKTPGTVARIYTMLSEWPAVKAAIATLPQQMQSHIRYWIADPTGYNHIVPGSDATQWYWGQSYDISTATPNF